MNADPGTSYHPLSDGPEDPPGAQSTANAIVGMGLTAPRHHWLHALRSYPDGNVEYHHGLPDLQRSYFGEPQCYTPPYVEQEGNRLVPFGVTQSAVSGFRSPPFSTSTPYVPSYHLLSSAPLKKWQSVGSFHPPTAVYGLHTPVQYPQTNSTPSLTLYGQNIFSPNDVVNMSPVDFESQTSQRSFASSWSNCSTPQAFLYSNHSPTPEVMTEPEPVDYLQRDSVLDNHSPKRGRSRNKVFKCDSCDKTFERNSNLKYHLTTHEQGRQSLVCEKTGCPRTFNRRADMSRHIRTAHEKTTKFTCPRCLREFGRNDTMKRHMKKTCQRTALSYRHRESHDISSMERRNATASSLSMEGIRTANVSPELDKFED